MAIDGHARAERSPPGELLERDRELGVLEDLIQGVLEGRRGLALVDGPAGIGMNVTLPATVVPSPSTPVLISAVPTAV